MQLLFYFRLTSNLRFAENTTLCAESEAEMKELRERVEREREKLGLSVNRHKTKMTVTDRGESLSQTNLLSGNERVDSELYGGSTEIIRRRTVLVRDAA